MDCVIRLGLLGDASVEARSVAAKALVERGESKQAARLILSVADILTKEERLAEAFEALKEAAQLDPSDQEIQLKRAAAAPPVGPPLQEGLCRGTSAFESEHEDPPLTLAVAEPDVCDCSRCRSCARHRASRSRAARVACRSSRSSRS